MNTIPMTRIKIAIAGIIYKLLHLARLPDRQIIKRQSIAYEVDLTEGIDLSLFLFGNFQNHIFKQRFFSIPEDAIIFDVGANIGSMTLMFARAAPKGLVYAFEPTDFAFGKLERNLSLNNELAKRVVLTKSFISDHDGIGSESSAYASWKVDGKENQQRAHPIHGGIAMPASNTPTMKLDTYCRNNNIHRVDFIKIDTDGHELQVLKGAETILHTYHPYLIFELGQYILEESNETFEELWSLLNLCGYSHLVNSQNGQVISLQNYHRCVPVKTTTDVIALPDVIHKNN